MKFKPILWLVFSGRMKKGLKAVVPREDAKFLLKKAKPIYKDLLSKMEGVSDNNPMATNITTSFIIISVWLASGKRITTEEMSRIMEIVVDWMPMKMLYGSIDMNTQKGIQAFSKMMHKNADWARRHPEDVNTWDFHFDEALHQDGFYYHFTHCPIADFCKKYGLEEINPVLCNIDFITMAMMHSVLHREHTIAEGGKLCDYWTVGNKIADPR